MNETHLARLALSLMDLTSLTDTESSDDIKELCNKAVTPFGHVAAVCVYPRFIKIAKAQLLANGGQRVNVATVVNFPDGNQSIDQVCQDITSAIQAGADEIDLVLPYKALQKGRLQDVQAMLEAANQACGDHCLKVIIESGELKQSTLIQQASELAITSGADFVKTSTGKVPINATPEAAETILNSIATSKQKVGFKASGGIRTLADAKAYLSIAARIMGDTWIDAAHFRFGASGLLDNLLATLNEQGIGSSANTSQTLNNDY